MAPTTYTADEAGKLTIEDLEKVLGDNVPTEGSGKDGKVVKKDLVAAVLAQQGDDAPPADDSAPADQGSGDRTADGPSGSGKKRKIERVTARGDWLDPFSGLMVHHSSDRCSESGAVRDGDHAVKE